MLAGLLLNAWTFAALFLVVMVGCLVEYVKIIRKIAGPKYLYYLPLALVYIVMPILMMLDLGIRYEVYTAGPVTQLIDYSPVLPCAVMFSIWINDTMAYIVGSMIGKTPFSSISPKKTWEGTAGGAVLCVAVIALLASVINVTKDK